ncbi:MAG: hypothetical protein R2912_10975 [Eubacteriales bacterium]
MPSTRYWQQRTLEAAADRIRPFLAGGGSFKDADPVSHADAPSPTPTPTPTPPYDIPHAVDSTQPAFTGLRVRLKSTAIASIPISAKRRSEFLPEEPYTNATGIITFRGNNYRDNAAFGVASVSQQSWLSLGR